MLDIKPAYAFLHKDSGMAAPQGLRREAPVVVDVTVGARMHGCSSWRGRAAAQGCVLLPCTSPTPAL